MLAWEHETIHFIHAITTAYLYNHSVATVKYAFSVLDNFQQFVGLAGKKTAFETTTAVLSVRRNGISVRDLLEGVAVLESFKLAYPNPGLDAFLGFRDHFFPGRSDSSYRSSFDYLAGRIGATFAYHLLAPLSFVALQSDNPTKSFARVVEERLPEASPNELVRIPAAELFSRFGMSSSDHLLFNLDSVPKEMRHPILYECAKHAVNMFGAAPLLELAARPSTINSSPQNKDAIAALLPPVVAFSSSCGSKLEGMTHGIAKQDNELAQLAVHTVGLIGAAERMTLQQRTSDPFQFCPHGASCPHYASALCFQYFAPPSIQLGYANCGFIRFFEHRTGMKPAEAWAKLGSQKLNRD